MGVFSLYLSNLLVYPRLAKGWDNITQWLYFIKMYTFWGLFSFLCTVLIEWFPRTELNKFRRGSHLMSSVKISLKLLGSEMSMRGTRFTFYPWKISPWKKHFKAKQLDIRHYTLVRATSLNILLLFIIIVNDLSII